MKYCFIYNPSTNRSRSENKYKQLKRITKNWEGVEYIESTSSNNLKELADNASRDFETVVACGGDGTVRDIAVSLMGTGANLGVIPMGSGNDFSKSLGIPRDLNKAIQVLKKGRRKPIGVGKCNNFHFINTIGFGFDGLTNEYAGQSAIKLGSLRYVWAALKTNFQMQPFTAKLEPDDSIVVENDWLMITAANGRIEGGNFIIAPNASLFDNKLELVTIEPISKWILPFLLPLFMIGKQEILPFVSSRQVNRIRLKSKRPVAIHTDGEQVYTEETDFTIELIPSAIKAIC